MLEIRAWEVQSAVLAMCKVRPIPNIPPIMENQMEKKMENEMETGVI